MQTAFFAIEALAGVAFGLAVTLVVLFFCGRPRDRALRDAMANLRNLSLALSITIALAGLTLIGGVYHDAPLFWFSGFFLVGCLSSDYKLIRNGGFRPKRPPQNAPQN